MSAAGHFGHTLSLLGGKYSGNPHNAVAFERRGSGAASERVQLTVCLDHEDGSGVASPAGEQARSGGGVSDHEPQASRIVGPESWCVSS